MNLDYSILEVARGAEASWDHPGISWPVNLDYFALEVARGAEASQDHPAWDILPCELGLLRT